ncbi:MAG TPA: hypothetical protein VF240_04055 [Pyrinomonadaceae bacterium]
MRKLDRLGWAESFTFESYGVRVGLRASRPGVLPALAEYLPPGWKPVTAGVVERLYSLVAAPDAPPGGRVRRFSLLYEGILRIARTHELEELFERFAADLHLYVAEAARRRVFVHAGVVGWRGRAIVLPGNSLSGKSTLVAELVRAGATYYSDEYAVLDRRGRVHPFARPLGIRDTQSGRQRRVTVESLDGTSGSRPLPVGLVVVSKYRPGSRWRPRRLSSGQGLLTLLSNTISVRRRPEAALDALQQVTAGAPVIKSTRGEARAAAEAILEAVESGPVALGAKRFQPGPTTRPD